MKIKTHFRETDRVDVRCSVRFDIQPGREGFVDFKSGQESIVYRAKNGHLMVVGLAVTVKRTGDMRTHWGTDQIVCLPYRNRPEPSPDESAALWLP